MHFLDLDQGIPMLGLLGLSQQNTTTHSKENTIWQDVEEAAHRGMELAVRLPKAGNWWNL
jgi:hypothetical protein